MNFKSYVISWNITRLCNEHCQHCYIHASPFADRARELTTPECLQVVNQLEAVSPGALLILTGGEPLLRKDVFEISRYATERGFMVVMGTNGTLISPERAALMKANGVRGVAVSIDSLDEARHDAFRGYRGAWANSVGGMQVLAEAGLPFIVQTTVTQQNYAEVEAIAGFAAARGAKVFNLYFLVPTGRGAFMTNITPDEYEALMHQLLALQPKFMGQMLVNAKCAPHFQRVLWEHDPASPLLKGFVGAGGCPAGTHYVGITPDGDVTPCPYLPEYGGNLRQKTFAEIWNGSELFTRIRQRKALGGRCGGCEFNTMCGGCRARAYGATGDDMAEDPWCTYQPGRHGLIQIQPVQSESYGVEIEFRMPWTAEAMGRIGRIPAFVRGMVVRQVEELALADGLSEVTGEVMIRIREGIGQRVAMVPSFLRGMAADRKHDGQETDRGLTQQL
jgi:radical SAM protein with 4Fe4S-binding SPASM domain